MMNGKKLKEGKKDNNDFFRKKNLEKITKDF